MHKLKKLIQRYSQSELQAWESLEDSQREQGERDYLEGQPWEPTDPFPKGQRIREEVWESPEEQVTSSNLNLKRRADRNLGDSQEGQAWDSCDDSQEGQIKN